MKNQTGNRGETGAKGGDVKQDNWSNLHYYGHFIIYSFPYDYL